MNRGPKFLLAALRTAITDNNEELLATLPLSMQEWKEVFRLAKLHGVTAIVLDAVASMSKECQPPMSVKIEWIGTAANIEHRYHFQYKAAAEFADIMHRHGIRTLVMKGLAFSTYYPKPEHRECGDLDCFLDCEFDKGNAIAVENGVRNDDGDYKHLHLNYKGLPIENHRFLTNFNATKRGKRTERLLQQYIKMPSRNIGDTTLQKPVAEFNALFLIKHAQKHFIDEGINLRHLFDWATLLKAEQDNLDWQKLYAEMKECHINGFADVLTEICHKHLGLTITNRALASTAHNPLSEDVLDDILSSHQISPKRERFIGKVLRILRRFGRMWRFRKIADESYATLVWNSFAFSSYLKRSPEL